MCLWLEYKTLVLVCLQDHATQMRDAHNSLSDTSILCSRDLWALICRFDWNRLPIAEVGRHDLQSGRDHKHTECKCIDCVHATDDVYTRLIKCFVQTTVAPPS